MLNGPAPTKGSLASQVLTRPYSGSRRRIQLRVTVKAGRKKAAQKRELDPAAPGQIRAREQPGDEDGERQREELADERDREGVDERGAQPRLAEGGPPAVEAVARRLSGRRDLEALEQRPARSGKTTHRATTARTTVHRTDWSSIRRGRSGVDRPRSGRPHAHHVRREAELRCARPRATSRARGRRSTMRCSPPSATARLVAVAHERAACR
mgnify:CR=1 FL=1